MIFYDNEHYKESKRI